MKTAGGFVCLAVELSAGMKGCKDYSLCGNSLLMHAYRDSSTVITNGTGAILSQCYPYILGISRQMLIHRIVQDFVDEVIETSGTYGTDVHTGSHSDRFKSLQDRDTRRIVFLCHLKLLKTRALQNAMQ